LCHYTPGCLARSKCCPGSHRDWEVCACVLLLSKLKCTTNLLLSGVGCSKKKRRKLPLCWTSKGNGVKLSSISAAGSWCISSAQLHPSQAERGKKRKEGKRPFLTTNKQTNKQTKDAGPGCKLSTWSAHPLCLLAVILIVAFCALILIPLVILLLHLNVEGD